MQANFIGVPNPSLNNWTKPRAWAGGAVPNSSPATDILIHKSSVDNLGSPQAPFVTDDVIGASAGLDLSVIGFLHAHDVKRLSTLSLTKGGSVSAHDIKNVQDLSVLTPRSRLEVSGDLTNIPHVLSTGAVLVHDSLANVREIDTSGFNSFALPLAGVVQVGHDVGKTKFVLGPQGGRLILDHPPAKHLDNAITLGNNSSIELGGISIANPDFIPSVPGSNTGRIELSTNTPSGHYTLSNVTLPAGGSSANLHVGLDKHIASLDQHGAGNWVLTYLG
jgi:hypothetical protein